jgi:hypothetical protein
VRAGLAVNAIRVVESISSSKFTICDLEEGPGIQHQVLPSPLKQFVGIESASRKLHETNQELLGGDQTLSPTFTDHTAILAATVIAAYEQVLEEENLLLLAPGR